MIFLNSASSAAALVFYLPGVCTHIDTEGKQRKTRAVRNILKSLEKTQYLMNTLYYMVLLVSWTRNLNSVFFRSEFKYNSDSTASEAYYIIKTYNKIVLYSLPNWFRLTHWVVISQLSEVSKQLSQGHPVYIIYFYHIL